MNLPFSHDAFLDVFGAFNTALWPGAALLWMATAWLAIRWLRFGRLGGRTSFTLLAAHWAWSGVAYHWFFFRAINPAALLFGAAFVVQAALFAILVRTARGRVDEGLTIRGVAGRILVFYGLLYPVLGLAFGLRYPRLPLFGVPCPTTLVTAGWLMASTGVPRFVSIVPLLWAGIGSIAAVSLGVRADFALIAAGIGLALDMVVPRARPAHLPA
jgi:hypothetical protein